MTKEHILKEIRRTAEANAGKPLGTGRFLAETGIKQSDWLGKYWARWGDALREAGLSPNRLQVAFDSEHLLRAYAGLIQELGHLPTEAELRLKARANRDFPSHETFRNRWGNKAEIIKRVGEFCRSRAEYQLVAELCDAYIAGSEVAAVDEEEFPVEIGFVYLIKSGSFYKIGRSNAVGRREYELTIQLPERAKTVHVIRTDDPTGIEEYWHKRFDAKRANGEWFALDASDIAAFKRRKFM